MFSPGQALHHYLALPALSFSLQNIAALKPCHVELLKEIQAGVEALVKEKHSKHVFRWGNISCFQVGKYVMIRRTAVREASASQHYGGPIDSLLSNIIAIWY